MFIPSVLGLMSKQKSSNAHSVKIPDSLNENNIKQILRKAYHNLDLKNLFQSIEFNKISRQQILDNNRINNSIVIPDKYDIEEILFHTEKMITPMKEIL